MTVKHFLLFIVLTSLAVDSIGAFKCGLDPVSNSRIVGGEEAKPHQFPWMAYVELRYNPINIPASGTYKYYTDSCGGTIIDSQWIVTAAHCFPQGDVTKYEGYQLAKTTIKLNAYNFSNADESRTVVQAEKVYIHEKYDDKALLYDIALIKLSSAINFDETNEKIAPICLPQEREIFSRSDCQTAGWGRTGTQEHDARVLKVADVKMLNGKSCKKYWPKHGFYLEVCAGGKDQRTCRGDSGGPLQCRNNSGQWVLQGVTSFSDSVCESEYPSVYTRVLKHMSWINQIKTTHK